MFAQIYAKRMEKWENIVIETLLESFKSNGWENVYFNEISKDDYGKCIEIVRIHEIYGMARNMINNQKVNRDIRTQIVLKKVIQNKLILQDQTNNKTKTMTINNNDDLLFLKEKPPKVEKPQVSKSDDPLRVWCQQFLTEYSHNDSVDNTIEKIPSYKPSQSQIKKLQNKRERDLLKWGSQF